MQTTDIRHFRLPRYEELPDVGLYLEQAVRYINECLAPLEQISLTPSMLRNYVKLHYISPPVRKLYDRDQIAYLIFMAIVKPSLPLPHIRTLFDIQQETSSCRDAYDNFCLRFEAMLSYLFGLRESPILYGEGAGYERQLFQSVIVASCHILYVRWCLDHGKTEAEGVAESSQNA